MEPAFDDNQTLLVIYVRLLVLKLLQMKMQVNDIF
jgi:hypothetical protein